MTLAKLLTFVPTFFVISLSPGLCMTLAMSLGISVGPRRAGWMMLGELTGLALVAVAAVLGAATILLQSPLFFQVFRLLGAAYLFYMGWQSWHAEPRAPGVGDTTGLRSRGALALQGFITATANPKAWIFLVALLPPFIDPAQPLPAQLGALIAIILLIELVCLQIYAHGGRKLADLLFRRGRARLLNQVSATLMVCVGLWLALG